MRVVVADDSTLFRKVMMDVLSTIPDVDIVGHASNGKLAVLKTQELRPDLLTLDMEMPEMDGLAVLDALKTSDYLPSVIVVSSLTRQGGKLTLQALQKGAFDFITKPNAINAEESRKLLFSELAPRLKSLSLRMGVRRILQRIPSSATQEPIKAQPLAPNVLLDSVSMRMSRLAGISKPELLLIGVSTGGPNALAALLPALPRLGIPIMIVQHMPPIFTQALAESLSSKCILNVREAVNGEIIEADTVYIAPGGRQMRLSPGSEGGKVIQITEDPPENNCRPAVDYLFRSVALHFPGVSVGVILTGMGSDGTLGLKLLKRRGCYVIAQNEASCVVYGMPKSAVEAGVVDEVLPLEAIAGRIAVVVRGGAL